MDADQDGKKIDTMADMLHEISVAIRRARYEELRKERRDRLPKALGGYGHKVFSQSDEDGILSEIFRRIGVENRMFVEFGVGDGFENNTLALLYDGWSGLWIEAESASYEAMKTAFSSALSSGQLRLIHGAVTPLNVNDLISSEIESQEIDLLSVDIDGNDAHVVEKISCIRPRVIVMEYNAKFGPSISYCMQYDASYVWRKTDRFGASLKYLEHLMRVRGYSCVGCNIVGTNAFFVRDDLLEDRFLAPFTSENHFEPARYELAGLPSGHPSSPETFAARVVPR